MGEGGTMDFDKHVLPSEHESINQRRMVLGRAPVGTIDKIDGARSEEVPPVYDTVGLALSGGGIRAAAISLGVLQALNKAGVIDKMDYLSTVSGGGYIGASLVATMTATRGQFVFVDEAPSPNVPRPAVAHLRNHSNCLLAGGKIGVASAVAIIVRNLVANVAIVMPFLLLLSALMIVLTPTSESLHAGFLRTHPLFSTPVVLGLILSLLWALYLSFLPARNLSDENSKLPAIGALYLVAVGFVLFAELQPLMLDGMFRSTHYVGGFRAYIADTVHYLALVGLPVGIMVALFQRRLGALLRRASDTSNLFVVLSAAGGRLAILLTAAEVVLLFWIVFLNLAFWGIKDQFVSRESPTSGYHAPDWIVEPAEALFGYATPIGWFYLVMGVVLLIVAGFLKPNTLTLFGLYRDRLRRAFLFDPATPSDKEYSPIIRFGVSDISSVYAPFYLINTALNIRGSSYANQRGRDADFFLFRRILPEA